MSNNFDILEALWLRREKKRREQKIIEGAPPLTYKAKKAGTLTDYRIYGNTVNGESVGELIETGEHAGEYRVPVTMTNGTDTQTTNIYLPEQIRKVGDEAEYVDYGQQKQHMVRKNLLQNTATSQTINGVTFTVNADGSVTCNGTAENITTFRWEINLTQDNEYILSGCPIGGGNATFRIDVATLTYVIIAVDTGSPATFTPQNEIFLIRIRIASGYVCNNLTFYPMIRKADIEDDTYEPYIEDTELDVTLPALPTLSGTNTLSVGTEVQPSKVIVKGKISQE